MQYPTIKYLEITYIGPPECIRDVQTQFLLCGGADADEPLLARGSVHFQAMLARAQEIGDEKVQIVQTIQDIIDNQEKSLDADCEKLNEYLNNPEPESEDDVSEKIKHSAKSGKEVEEILDEVEQSSDEEEVSQDEGELGVSRVHHSEDSDDVEMGWSKDSDDEDIMSDEDVSAMSEDTEISDDLDDFISSTENSEESNFSGDTFNTSDCEDTSDNSSD